jgi:hypothetical protein
MSSVMQASMSDQLLWFETLLKGSIGLILIFLPITAARMAGLPHGNVAFWPRLFGAALLGIAGAFAVEGYNLAGGAIEAKGLGLGGAVIINLTTIVSLFGTLIFSAVATRRGKVLIWLMILVLLFLTLFEIGQTGQ